MSTKCIYFAYGSNLLAKRMHVCNPRAVRCGKGVLNNYIIEFGGYGALWGGAAANIRKKPDSKVWGALWELNLEDVPNLDKQEGVDEKFYSPLSVEIETPNGTKINCRTYEQIQKFEEIDLADYPINRRPSKSYLATIVKGAKESELPQDYINFLKKIPTNNSDQVPKFIGDILKEKLL